MSKLVSANTCHIQFFDKICTQFLNLMPFGYFLQGELGKWCYKSKSQSTMHEGYMFPLHVMKQLEDWPEKNIRKREWVSLYLYYLSINIAEYPKKISVS